MNRIFVIIISKRIRQYAQPIRLLLAYAGVEHEDQRYEDEEEALWMQEKPNLGLDFPNVRIIYSLTNIE